MGNCCSSEKEAKGEKEPLLQDEPSPSDQRSAGVYDDLGNDKALPPSAVDMSSTPAEEQIDLMADMETADVPEALPGDAVLVRKKSASHKRLSNAADQQAVYVAPALPGKSQEQIEKESAAVLTRAGRVYLARKRAAQLRKERAENTAAVIVQASVRAYLARKLAAQKLKAKKENAAAHCMIRLSRAHVARMATNPQLELSRKRLRKVREFYDTEKSYVEQLTVLVNEFYEPLLRSNEILRPELVLSMFSNAKVVLKVNKAFLDALTERLVPCGFHHNVCIGDLLAKDLVPHVISTYTEFVGNYDSALEVLNACKKKAPFNSFLQTQYSQISLAQCKRWELPSFLILPVQRVPRYLMLLQDIIKVSSETHPDYVALQQAYKGLQTAMVSINESKRQKDSNRSIEKLESKLLLPGKQPMPVMAAERIYVREGPIIQIIRTKEDGKDVIKEKERYMFLFNDLAMFTKKVSKHMVSRGFNATFRFEFKDTIPLKGCTMITKGSLIKRKNNFILAPAGTDNVGYSFCSLDEQDHVEWLAALRTQTMVQEVTTKAPEVVFDNNDEDDEEEKKASPVEPAAAIAPAAAAPVVVEAATSAPAEEEDAEADEAPQVVNASVAVGRKKKKKNKRKTAQEVFQAAGGEGAQDAQNTEAAK